MSEKTLVALSFAALSLVIIVACGVAWTYAVPR